MKKILLLSFIILFQNTFALSEGVYTVIVKKQEEKKKNRWTLADWLVTKKTIALQDQWLALNSSETWFEFVFDYAGSTLEETSLGTKQDMDFSRWGGAAYLKFIGLEYSKLDYERNYKQSDLRLNLLILGSSIQSTHLRAFYGQRDFDVQGFGAFEQPFWGLHMTLYLASFLGVAGQYTKFMNESSGTISTDGERSELTGFIDLWLLRLYASLYSERNLLRGSVSTSNRKIDGTLLGVKLFF
ncbi:MAG: hypothetical protein VXV96_14725 [Bdellovibrionota bacterium]|nr:hypothetical protein [Bdellovibrionota bacterium]